MDGREVEPNSKAFLKSARVRVNPWLILLLFVTSAAGFAQDNYEIQVYSSDTVPQGNTMVELHSNFTVHGSPVPIDRVYPTDHVEHETLEVTQGITPWFEIGSYLFTAISKDHGWDWVGDHIRPRVRAPDSWRLPVGLSLSAEVGYQRPGVFRGHLDAGAAAHHR